MTIWRRSIPMIVIATLVGAAGGCSGSDNPTIALAPAYQAPENKAPGKIPGRKNPYGSSDRYQKAMERANTR